MRRSVPVAKLGSSRSCLVTFISPQNGIAKAPLAASFAGWPALHDPSPGSDFLDAVNSAPRPANVAVTSIYTCTDEFIQPYETSIIPGATNIGLCDGSVGHYQFFWDPEIYLVMHTALTEPVAATTPDPADPADPADPSLPPENDAGGCATGGGSTGGGLVFVLGALVAVSRRRRSRASRDLLADRPSYTCDRVVARLPAPTAVGLR